MTVFVFKLWRSRPVGLLVVRIGLLKACARTTPGRSASSEAGGAHNALRGRVHSAFSCSRCGPNRTPSHSTPSCVAGTLSIRLWLAPRTALGQGAAPETRGASCSALWLAPIVHSFVHRHATKEEILSFRNASKASEAPYQCRPRLPISTRPQLSDCQPSRVSLHIPSPRRYRGCNGDENCRL